MAEDLIPKIGLEIHVELKTKSKMFCSCKNDPDEKRPNFNICPICLGLPGVLPQINREAVRKVIKTGIALNCKILKFSKFDRKNYFYPDLPKGYQISQYDLPLCKEGFLKINNKKIRIERIHLEEDTARAIHLKEEDISLIDFNRAGVPLMELVTKPDISSPKEAEDFAKELKLILKYLDVSEADMEKGQMRVEANVSLGKGKKLGKKVEIKNINSFKAVRKALEYEIKRQKEILEKGKEIIQETRGWDDRKEITFSQRWKEEAKDYRYFPEPDLPPLKISIFQIEKIRSEIPELPQEKRERFEKEYNLSRKEIEILIREKEMGEYFEKVISELFDWANTVSLKISKKNLINKTINYFLTDFISLLRKYNFSIDKSLVTPEDFAEFITLLYTKNISSKIAKNLLEEMVKKGIDPSHILDEKGWRKIENIKEIEEILDKVISENEQAVRDYKEGKERAIQFLIGKAMEKSKGKIDPQKAEKILKEKLRS